MTFDYAWVLGGKLVHRTGHHYYEGGGRAAQSCNKILALSSGLSCIYVENSGTLIAGRRTHDYFLGKSDADPGSYIRSCVTVFLSRSEEGGF